jgi:tyrosyl-tRNA synthetase
MPLKILESTITECIPAESLTELLSGQKKLTIKFGADPSAPDLHLGHTVILRQLRRMQDLGHFVIFLIGDFTAMIGDPTGKSKTRQPLSKQTVLQNATTYQNQVLKILHPDKTKIVFNSDWLSSFSAEHLISLASRFNVARMLERDDFNNRFTQNKSIRIHEFLYPLLQGYDSVHLENDIEVGGTDQKFNLLVGRHLQREYQKKTQSIITFPLLEGLDGSQKMSKSLNNHVGLTDSPTDMFGKIMSLPDHLIIRYFKLTTSLAIDHIEHLEKQLKNGENPREIKDILAQTIVTDSHSSDAAQDASTQFKAVFSNKKAPENIAALSVKKPGMLSNIVVKAGILSSKKEFQRLVQQGAISINGNQISDPFIHVTTNMNEILKIGKLKFFKLI